MREMSFRLRRLALLPLGALVAACGSAAPPPPCPRVPPPPSAAPPVAIAPPVAPTAPASGTVMRAARRTALHAEKADGRVAVILPQGTEVVVRAGGSGALLVDLPEAA